MGSEQATHHVVVVGGGFGGLYAARALRGRNVRVTLIDRQNFHLFQPLLYQVATGALSPANIAAPLRSILRRRKNVTVLLGEVVDIDAALGRVVLRDSAVEFDTLVVATGAAHNYFGHPEWEQLAPGLKTIDDATAIRARILSAFENAERAAIFRSGGPTGPANSARTKVRGSPATDAWLTFVVIGAGPTGVELAGALAEVARHTLRRDFRNIDPARANILLLEGGDRVLPTFPPDLSRQAEASLRKLGVTVRTRTMVTEIGTESVTVRCGDPLRGGGLSPQLNAWDNPRRNTTPVSPGGDRTERIATHTVVWAAGVRVSPLAQALQRGRGVALDRVGRVIVEADLSVPGHPHIFVIGDLAHVKDAKGVPLPGVAPVAMQEGRYVARLVRARLRGNRIHPFRYVDRGNMATIGRAAAVADLGFVRLSGFIAWLIWLFLHLMYLVQFQNRVLVFTQWAWNYFTRNRSARLITGEPRAAEGENE